MRTKYINACKELLTLPTSKHSTNVGYYFFPYQYITNYAVWLGKVGLKSSPAQPNHFSQIFLGSGFQISFNPNSPQLHLLPLVSHQDASLKHHENKQSRGTEGEQENGPTHEAIIQFPGSHPLFYWNMKKMIYNRTEPFFLVATPQCPLPTPLNIIFSTNPLNLSNEYNLYGCYTATN